MSQWERRQNYNVSQRGVGFQDYNRVVRSKSLYGYEREFNEDIFWMLLISCPPDHPAGPTIFTINGIAAGAEVAVNSVFQGTPFHINPPGTDYVIKEMWMSFNQDCRVIFWQPAFGPPGDVACLSYFQARSKPTNPFMTGWTRTLLEPITVQGTLFVYVRNEGAGIMYGKCWLCGYEKSESYVWF
jgi:hypothetical protein